MMIGKIIHNKDGTFEYNRPITTLNHLIQDYKNNITEKDLTHLDEILRLQDLSMDIEAGTNVGFHDRSKKNYENRCLYHHVFNVELIVQFIDYMQLKIKSVERIAPMYILIISQKLHKDIASNNIKCFDYITLKQFHTSFSLEDE